MTEIQRAGKIEGDGSQIQEFRSSGARNHGIPKRRGRETPHRSPRRCLRDALA